MAGEWVQGLDEATRTQITGRGLHEQEPAGAVSALVKGLLETEAKLGIPADRVLRLPDKPDAPEWAAVYERLGKPKEVTAYDFADVKGKDGAALDQSTADFARSLAHELNLPIAAGKRLASALIERADKDASDRATALAASNGAAETQLQMNWASLPGGYATQKAIAVKAAEALGLDAAAMDAVGRQIGVAKFMESLRALGGKLGEARLLGFDNGGGAGGGTNSYTFDQAQVRKQSLMQDREWANSYLNGDTKKVEEMGNLNAIIARGRMGG